MKGSHLHTLWILAIVIAVIAVAVYLFLLQIGILDWNLSVEEF